jgi:hypothetical protein
MQATAPGGVEMTNKRNAYSLLSILLFFFSSTGLQGQVNDFNTWWELELNKKITGRLDLNGELEQRFQNNSLQYGRTMVTLEASFELLDFLSLAGGTRLNLVKDGEQNLQSRYRLHLDLEGEHHLSGFDLSLRTRLQYGFDDFLAFDYFELDAIVNRNRLKVNRHIFGTRIDWFASAESYHGSNRQSPWRIYAMRYSAGARYSFSFRSRVSLRYIFEDELNVPDPRKLYILAAGYSYEL